MLATAGDDGNVLLWVPSETHSSQPAFGEDGVEDKETWRVKHMCRSSGSEIYDLAWSPDAVFFITGSMDNVARIYNASTGRQSPSEQLAETKLKSYRSNGTTDCRTQSLCPRRCLGPSERVCSDSVIGSFSPYIQFEEQRGPIHAQPAQQSLENGPASSTHIVW